MRMCDFVSDEFPELYRDLLKVKNKQIVDLGGTPIDYEKTVKEYLDIQKQIKPLVTDTISMIAKARKEGKRFCLKVHKGLY